MKISILLLGLFASGSILAQISYPDNFLHLLKNANVDFYEPTEGSYKDIRLSKADYQPCDFALRSRREKLEMRYLVAPYSPHNWVFTAPHVEALRMASHLATNEQESVITSFAVSETELTSHFNANWGRVYFFQPKPIFSDRKHCKMLALYAEGKGMVIVFFLFDEPSRELDNRHLALRFRDDELEAER